MNFCDSVFFLWKWPFTVQSERTCHSEEREIMPSNPHCCSWSSLWLWAGCDISHCQVKIDNIIYESYETWRVKEKDCNTWSVWLYELSPKLEMLLALENHAGFWKNQVDKKTEKDSLVDCDWFLFFHTLKLMRFLLCFSDFQVEYGFSSINWQQNLKQLLVQLWVSATGKGFLRQ